MRQAIVTGSNGQDGYYLLEILRRNHIEPVVVPRASGIDLSNADVVLDLVQSVRPAYVFHLAAHSTVNHVLAIPNHATIATGALTLLEAVRQVVPTCRVFLPGSAYQFKNYGAPIHENDSRESKSIYCAAREYAYQMAKIYRDMGVAVYWGYLFHHESPRRSPAHISQKIAQAAKRRQMIEIGDPSVVKEWTWAGDTMEAAWMLVNQDRIWEANIGSGVGHSIADFARLCFFEKGLDWQQFVKENPAYESSFRSLTANPERIHSLGWSPRHDLQYLAHEMTK